MEPLSSLPVDNVKDVLFVLYDFLTICVFYFGFKLGNSILR